MRTTKAATSLAVGRRPSFLDELPSYLWAINFRCHDSSVSGVTMVATNREQFATELLRFRGQSTPLIVTKPQPLTPDLFSQNAILLHQIFDNLLMAVYP